MTIAVCGVLVGADNFQEIELWAGNALSGSASFLPLKNGIP
ncbi:transposase family protein, partial [Escherichia coli]|nr:transposase family protein [Escherichia coli]